MGPKRRDSFPTDQSCVAHSRKSRSHPSRARFDGLAACYRFCYHHGERPVAMHCDGTREKPRQACDLRRCVAMVCYLAKLLSF